MYNVRNGAISMENTYLSAIVLFALYVPIYEIFTNQIKCQKFDLENEGRGHGGESLDLCSSTRDIRVYVGVFFYRILAIRQHVYANVTDIHTQTHSERQMR